MGASDTLAPYVGVGLIQGPPLWGQALKDESVTLGFELLYQSLPRKNRDRCLLPECQACRTAVQRPSAVIEHPPHLPVNEVQFDWLELPDGSPGWGADLGDTTVVAAAMLDGPPHRCVALNPDGKSTRFRAYQDAEQLQGHHGRPANTQSQLTPRGRAAEHLG